MEKYKQLARQYHTSFAIIEFLLFARAGYLAQQVVAAGKKLKDNCEDKFVAACFASFRKFKREETHMHR